MYTPTQRLMRSRNEKVLGGVAGGIARYLVIDPVIIRLAFVAFAFTGVGIILYPILWVIMPMEGEDGASQVYVAHDSTPQRPRYDPMTGEPAGNEEEIPINNVVPPAPDPAATTRRNQMLAYALLIVGALFLLSSVLGLGALIGKLLFPALLIGVGVYLLGRNRG